MSFSSNNPRQSLTRRQRSDSIPEDRPSDAAAATDNSMDLLMRHSSPLVMTAGRTNVASPLGERNGSPSPLRLNRPRSNPRNRTPNRANEEEPERVERRVAERQETMEGRRITIRPMAGAAVGTNIAGTRVSWM